MRRLRPGAARAHGGAGRAVRPGLLLLLLLHPDRARQREGQRGGGAGALPAGAGRAGGRAGEQRRLPPEAGGGAGPPRARHRPGAASGGGGAGRRCRDGARLLHRGARRGAGGGRAAGLAPLRIQRARPCGRHPGFRARHRPPAPSGRHRHHRGALPARPGRPPRIRHHLPRAPLLLLGDGAARAVPAPGPAPERRGAHPHPRRLAPHLRPEAGRAERAPARHAGRGAGERARPAGGLPRLRGERRVGRAGAAGPPPRPPGRGQARRRLRRRGQGHDPAQLLPDRRGRPPLDRRQEPAQARAARAGDEGADRGHRPHRGRPAGLPADPALEPPRGDHAAAGRLRPARRALHHPDPAAADRGRREEEP